MNAKIKTALTCIMVIFFSIPFGCSSKNDNTVTQFSNGPISEKDDQYCFVQNGYEVNLTKSSNGYYFHADNPYGQFLFYMDKSTMKPVYLCDKPDCLHGNEENSKRRFVCNAYLNNFQKDPSSFSASGADSNLIFYESKLYAVIEVFENMETLYHLYEFSSDGTQRRKIFTFRDQPIRIIIHHDYLYYVTISFKEKEAEENEENISSIYDLSPSSESTACIYRFNIYNIHDEPELVYEYDGIMANIAEMVGYMDNIYFVPFIHNADKDEYSNQLYSYNISSGEVSVVLQKTGKYAICGNKIIYYLPDGKHGYTYICDLDGSDSRILDNVTGIPYSDDRYIVTDTSYMAYSGDKDNRGMPVTKNLLNIYDLNGKLLQSFALGPFGSVEILGGDADYFFLYENYTIDDKNYEKRLWYINKNDIPNGNAKLVNFYTVKFKNGMY